MPKDTEEINRNQYKKLLSRLNPKEASAAKRAWAQITRYKNASSPTSVVILILIIGDPASIAYKGGIGEKIACLLWIFVLYLAHWLGYRHLQRQRNQAQQLIHNLMLKS